MEIFSEPEWVEVRQEYRVLNITSELRTEKVRWAFRGGQAAHRVGSDGISAVTGNAYDGML